MHQERQNLQSTKQKHPKPTNIEAIKSHFKKLKEKKKTGQSIQEVLHQELDEDSFPNPPTPNLKTNDVNYMVIDRNELGTAYTDLTGRFPCQSSSGNKYVLVAYHYDGNCVVGRALKIEEKKQ